MTSSKWTPLLAVAQSHRAPQPAKRAENTVEGLKVARAKLKSVDPKLIAERDNHRVEIAKLLIAAKAKLNLDDGYGATALASSVYSGFDDLSLLLIKSDANIETKTGIYLDGSGDIRPMHRATKSPKVLAALIKRGAKVNVVDTSGSTPLHWAVLGGHVESVKLLVAAGANTNATDSTGRLPSYWCKRYGDAKNAKIAQLLSAEYKTQLIQEEILSGNDSGTR